MAPPERAAEPHLEAGILLLLLCVQLHLPHQPLPVRPAVKIAGIRIQQPAGESRSVLQSVGPHSCMPQLSLRESKRSEPPDSWFKLAATESAYISACHRSVSEAAHNAGPLGSQQTSMEGMTGRMQQQWDRLA